MASVLLRRRLETFDRHAHCLDHPAVMRMAVTKIAPACFAPICGAPGRHHAGLNFGLQAAAAASEISAPAPSDPAALLNFVPADAKAFEGLSEANRISARSYDADRAGVRLLARKAVIDGQEATLMINELPGGETGTIEVRQAGVSTLIRRNDQPVDCPHRVVQLECWCMVRLGFMGRFVSGVGAVSQGAPRGSGLSSCAPKYERHHRHQQPRSIWAANAWMQGIACETAVL